MEKMKTKDTVEFTATDMKAMTHAAYAQCFFILAQVLTFPTLGVVGTIMAALCGLMPWLIKFAKESTTKALSMIVATLCLAPVFGKYCAFLISAFLEV